MDFKNTPHTMGEDRVPDTVESYFEKPKFWDNDERMNSWFTVFRSRELNPLNYDNKMNYWKDNVEFFCNKTNKCVLSLQEVKNFFIRKGRVPACLSPVFEALQSDGAILPVSEYEEFLVNDTWSGWTKNALLASPMKWLSKKVGTTVNSPGPAVDECSKFIHMVSLRRQANCLRECVTKEVKNGLVTYETVKDIYSRKMNEPVDMQVIKILVQWLVHEKTANITYEQKHLNTHLLKFSIDSKPADAIDETEITLFCLQEQEKILSAKLEQYEQEVQDLVAEVKDRLRQGHKNKARSILRKKRELEKRIGKVVNALDNIQILLHTVEETESDQQIIKTYQAGAQTLKSKFTKGDLNLSQVDNTMSEVDEVLNMHADLQETLGQSISSDPTEADLEDELSSLLLNDAPSVPRGRPNNQKRSSLGIDDLPAVPRSLPESMKVKNLRSE